MIEYGGQASAVKTADSIVPALVDKCLGSARAGTRSKAVELCVLFVECSSASDPTTTGLVDGLKAKQPKTVSGCVAALRELVQCVRSAVFSLM